jgi:DNA-binding NarL/FixJ family response regulator
MMPTEPIGPSNLADYPVLILEEHEMIATVLSIALREHGIDAHEVKPGRLDAILDQSSELRPGMAILGIDLGTDPDGEPLDGVDLVTKLRSLGRAVLVILGHHNQARIAAAIAADALGVVPTDCTLETLIQTILAAAAGHPVMSSAERDGWLAHHKRNEFEKRRLEQRMGRLTAREREVLALLAQGYRAAGLAEHFVVSLSTVRTHIHDILTKLEVRSQLEAIALADRARWW